LFTTTHVVVCVLLCIFYWIGIVWGVGGGGGGA